MLNLTQELESLAWERSDRCKIWLNKWGHVPPSPVSLSCGALEYSCYRQILTCGGIVNEFS